MKDNYMKKRGSSLWKESMNQPNLLYLGGNKKNRGVTGVNPQTMDLKRSDVDLNRDDSYDFESIAGVSLGKHSSMAPVKPGKRSLLGRGSMSNSQYFANQLAVLNQSSVGSQKERVSTYMYGTSNYGPSAYSGSMYYPQGNNSIIKRKVRTKKTEAREKLVKEKRSLTWTDRSMISHISLYITLLFGIYAAVFLVMLSNSSHYYSERINAIMKESFRSEKAYHISGILNSTITQAKSYFDLQA